MDPAAESAKLELLEAGRAMLLVSACAGTPMNAAMFGVFGGKAYYLYSGSSLEGNARCGPVHLIWTGLQRLKEQGITCVNLGGALPGGGTDGRERELYRFKKDFGTAIVRQPAGVKTIGRLGVSLQAFASRLRRSGH
jgi:lipid II:glycine glycyltransferase (peptidoglycan interpeptide bridge formation enzyme)